MYAEEVARKRLGPKSLRHFTSTVEIRKHDFQVGLLQDILKFCALLGRGLDNIVLNLFSLSCLFDDIVSIETTQRGSVVG
jgi:hypothetical protein